MLLGILFSASVLGGLLLMLAVMLLWRRRERALGRRTPLTKNLLRSPGESLRRQIEDLRWDVAIYLGIGALPVPMTLGIYLAHWVANGKAPSVVTIVALTIFALASLGWLAWKMWRVLRRLRRLHLAYDAELAVGQELNDLTRSGYHVFHDFPVDAERFNIDHIVAGPGGVFAIETKGRTRPASASRKDPSWQVTYDGSSLQFPGWIERKPLEQAERAGAWLHKWLSSAVGGRVNVQAVVVLPGWFVKRTAGNGLPVLAAGQLASYFRGLSPTMDEQLIRRVAHQLEQRCRDVTPASRKQDRSFQAHQAQNT
jgi:hypothetical protein